MKKPMLIILILLLLTGCAGTTLPYDLTGTGSVELHAYDNQSGVPYARLIVDGEEVQNLTDHFSGLSLREMDYTEPMIHGYVLWFRNGDDNLLAHITLPYGPEPWVICGGTAYQVTGEPVDTDLLSRLVETTVHTGPASPD